MTLASFAFGKLSNLRSNYERVQQTFFVFSPSFSNTFYLCHSYVPITFNTTVCFAAHAIQKMQLEQLFINRNLSKFGRLRTINSNSQ